MKDTEKELREIRNKYQSLIQRKPDVIWIKDFEGNTTFISPNVEKIYGYTPDEFYTGDSDEIWFGRINPDDAKKVRKAYNNLFK